MKFLNPIISVNPNTAWQRGFSLAELLVTIAVGTATIGIAFTVAFNNRNLYIKDNARTNTSQNLRVAMDTIGSDIRQAGEYITNRNFPVIILENDAAGDTLVVRRGLEETILPVCSDVSGSNTSISIALPSPVNEQCSRVGRDTDPTEIWPDNIYNWQTLRTGQTGQQGWAFIFDFDNSPTDGEFFTYSGESRVPESTPADPDTPSTYSVTRTAGAWSNSYSTGGANLPSLTLLEERRFSLDGDGNLVLETIDFTTQTGAQFLVNGVTHFQVTVTMQDGTVLTQFQPGDDWSQIASIDVSLSGETFYSATESIDQTLTSSFLPRNVLSFTQ
ncbi:MAG: PilW family protein [Synechococcus sp.]